MELDRGSASSLDVKDSIPSGAHHRRHPRRSSQDDDAYAEEDQPPGINPVIFVELRPRQDCSAAPRNKSDDQQARMTRDLVMTHM